MALPLEPQKPVHNFVDGLILQPKFFGAIAPWGSIHAELVPDIVCGRKHVRRSLNW